MVNLDEVHRELRIEIGGGVMIQTKSILTLTEQEVRKILQSEDWIVLRKGWPDFLCLRNDEVIAVEVKSGGDDYRPEQLAIIDALGQFFPIVGIHDNRRNIIARPYAPGELHKLINRPMYALPKKDSDDAKTSAEARKAAA